MHSSLFKKNASILLLGILALVVVFHLLVIAGIIPFSIVWGGRLTSKEEMIVFELVSIGLNLLMITVVAVHSGLIRIRISPRVIRGLLWCMAILFIVNTVGNLMSVSETEKMIFTPLTMILSVLTLMIVLSKPGSMQ